MPVFLAEQRGMNVKKAQQITLEKRVLRRFVPQLCTKTPDKQIQNVESASFTRKKSTNLNVRINPDLSIGKPCQGLFSGKSELVRTLSFSSMNS